VRTRRIRFSHGAERSLLGHADHVAHLRRDFTARLEEAGFAVRVEDYTRQLGESEARRYGLRPRALDLHLCLKNIARWRRRGPIPWRRLAALPEHGSPVDCVHLI
jgi:hypothetical protein